MVKLFVLKYVHNKSSHYLFEFVIGEMIIVPYNYQKRQHKAETCQRAGLYAVDITTPLSPSSAKLKPPAVPSSTQTLNRGSVMHRDKSSVSRAL